MAASWARPAEPPGEAVAAARTGLPLFLNAIAAESKALYGFPPDADLGAAELGEALLLRTITPAALQEDAAPETTAKLLADTQLWFFQVRFAREIKAMLVVDFHEGAWKAVSLGYAPLASEWNAVRRQWPREKGFHPQLAAVFPAKRFYFTVPEVDARNLTRMLTSTAGAGGSGKGLPQEAARYSKLGTVSAEYGDLKAAVRQILSTPAP